MVDDEPLLQPQPLPIPPTSFVGRATLCAVIPTRLGQPGARLLTLTGPGGVGKTRLAIEAARSVEPAFADGVAFVDLSPVADPERVPGAIAEALGVRDPGARVAEAVIAAVCERELLLVLDNVEQVIEAAPFMGRLLGAAAGVRVLATSREPLRIGAEQVVVVPPLDVPGAGDGELAGAEAIQLLVARARAAGSEVTPERDGRVLAEIVRHLDGLPLAIELAAARLPLLTPAALLDRLERRLPVLGTGGRDAPQRQRTMRDAIAWSYDLLPAEEQALFCRLAVFGGGFTLEAAIALQAELGAPPEVLDRLAALVERSLVQRVVDGGDQPRFRLLETIRAFAAEQLAAAGEAERAAAAHALVFLELAETASAELRGGEQGAWIVRLERDHANLRAALGWAIEHEESETALRLVIALSTFWSIRGYQREGGEWHARTLALPAPADGADLPADACRTASALAWALGDFALATRYGEEGLALARAGGDPARQAGALINLGVIAGRMDDHPGARARFDEALATARAAGDRSLIAAALTNLGLEATEAGDHTGARVYLEEALDAFRALGDQHRVSQAVANLALVAQRQGDRERAGRLYEEALGMHRALGDDRSTAITLEDYAGLLTALGERDRAAAALTESAILSVRVGNLGMAGGTLLRLAELEPERDRAAWLLGAADALLHAGRAPLPAELAAIVEQIEQAARGRLGDVRFELARSAARGLPADRIAEQLATRARAEPSARDQAAGPAAGLAEGLTVREAQVLRLLVDGKTDREIAATLFISPKTASNHVGNILAKLGVETRTAAAAFALRHGLA